MTRRITIGDLDGRELCVRPTTLPGGGHAVSIYPRGALRMRRLDPDGVKVLRDGLTSYLQSIGRDA